MDENQAPQLAEALQAAVPLQPANRRWTGNLKEIDSKAWDGAMDGFKSEANYNKSLLDFDQHQFTGVTDGDLNSMFKSYIKYKVRTHDY